MKTKEISFVSTRNSKNKFSFWHSLIQGMADDGGLLVPEYFPTFSKKLLNDTSFWLNLKVPDISYMLLRAFIPQSEVSDIELKKMLTLAHNFEIPLEKINSGRKNTYIARLDQGPTASFKDIAARALAKLIELYCQKNKKKVNIVVATSGDTGVAVADAFGNSAYVKVTVLYPTDGVSDIQERQMLNVHHSYKNEQVIPIKGNFDLCQDIAKLIQQARNNEPAAVKKLAEDIKFKLAKSISLSEAQSLSDTVSGLNISSANSINIWRLLPQMTQYFSSYASLVKKGAIKPGQKIVFAVPSGNIGHLMAGIYAHRLGLPIKLFIAGTNANNILANIIGSGRLKHRGFMKTSSPSMDILDPSNLERLLSYIAHETVIDFVGMKKDIKQNQNIQGIDLEKYGVTPSMLSALQSLIWVEDIETDEEVYAMMHHVMDTNGIILEPHGVTAFIASMRARAKKIINSDDFIVVFETAHPDKFPDALRAADIKQSMIHQHPTLEKIKKLRNNGKNKNSQLKKPESVLPDLKKIVQKISNL